MSALNNFAFTGKFPGAISETITDWFASIDTNSAMAGAAKPVSPSEGSDTSDAADSSTDYGFSEYLEGLFSSVGAENEANRQFNSDEAKAQREWQAIENEKNRKWQTEMANSAYTRASNDLKRAGLNPILAATNGATSTPSGVVGAGSSASYNVGGGDTLSSILNSISGIASAISGFLPSNKVVQVFKALGSAK